MQGYCPLCEKTTELEDVSREEEIAIRGDTIPVRLDFVRCSLCNEEIVDPESDSDFMEIAFREYRRRHKMLSSEEIKELRTRHNLTQEEFAKLLGCGVTTLSRYENGALQSEAQDIMLRLIKDDPRNLLRLIEENPQAIARSKKESLVKELKKEDMERFSPASVFARWFGGRPDIFSGLKDLDIKRLFNVILLFCSDENVFTTKLNKLLFYCDFLHFKNHRIGITGLKYRALPFGPAPENWDFYLGELVRERLLDVEEIVFQDASGYRYCSLVEPDLSIFSREELSTLFTVKNCFKDCTATQIMNKSHEEKAYLETAEKEEISYELAQELQLSGTATDITPPATSGAT